VVALPPGGQFRISGDILVAATGREQVTGIQGVEANHAAKRPTMHGTAPQQGMIWLKMSVVPWLRKQALQRRQLCVWDTSCASFWILLVPPLNPVIAVVL